MGCKDGTLLLIDYAASRICHKVKAHDSAIWSLDVRRSFDDEEREEVRSGEDVLRGAKDEQALRIPILTS